MTRPQPAPLRSVAVFVALCALHPVLSAVWIFAEGCEPRAERRTDGLGLVALCASPALIFRYLFMPFPIVEPFEEKLPMIGELFHVLSILVLSGVMLALASLMGSGLHRLLAERAARIMRVACFAVGALVLAAAIFGAAQAATLPESEQAYLRSLPAAEEVDIDPESFPRPYDARATKLRDAPAGLVIVVDGGVGEVTTSYGAAFTEDGRGPFVLEPRHVLDRIAPGELVLVLGAIGATLGLLFAAVAIRHERMRRRVAGGARGWKHDGSVTLEVRDEAIEVDAHTLSLRDGPVTLLDLVSAPVSFRTAPALRASAVSGDREVLAAEHDAKARMSMSTALGLAATLGTYVVTHAVGALLGRIVRGHVG